jgi:glycosyltransferase involved in cell wall biosynthesis
MSRFELKVPVSVQRWFPGPELDIEFELRPPPYGGGNQFLRALKNEWIRQGITVDNCKVGSRTRGALFISFQYDPKRVRAIQKLPIRKIHRVDGPISVYRGGRDLEVDEALWKMNRETADVTVFQSAYSLDKHLEMGMKFNNPFIIPNAVDPAIFHANDRITPFTEKPRKIRVIATAWSSNPKKGGQTYAWLDRVLDRDRFEFTFMGNVKEKLEHARIIPPLGSEAVAEELRRHDIYLTASENDCCSNALIEALACGLPAIYHDSGGNRGLVGQAGIGYLNPEDLPSMLDEVARRYDHYRSQIAVRSLEDVAQDYLKLFAGQPLL